MCGRGYSKRLTRNGPYYCRFRKNRELRAHFRKLKVNCIIYKKNCPLPIIIYRKTRMIAGEISNIFSNFRTILIISWKLKIELLYRFFDIFFGFKILRFIVPFYESMRFRVGGGVQVQKMTY